MVIMSMKATSNDDYKAVFTRTTLHKLVKSYKKHVVRIQHDVLLRILTANVQKTGERVIL
jgi:hypothetical protein